MYPRHKSCAELGFNACDGELKHHSDHVHYSKSDQFHSEPDT